MICKSCNSKVEKIYDAYYGCSCFLIFIDYCFSSEKLKMFTNSKNVILLEFKEYYSFIIDYDACKVYRMFLGKSRDNILDIELLNINYNFELDILDDENISLFSEYYERIFENLIFE